MYILGIHFTGWRHARYRKRAGGPSGQKPVSRGFGGCLPKLSPMLAHGGNAWSLLSHGADVVAGKKNKNIENTLFKEFGGFTPRSTFWSSPIRPHDSLSSITRR